ncbi:MAG: hypothetical protein MZW92_69775 [Comamonadaceae bacterium]|nr:hypothetical protein [Comamonadaceae bacterium]
MATRRAGIAANSRTREFPHAEIRTPVAAEGRRRERGRVHAGALRPDQHRGRGAGRRDGAGDAVRAHRARARRADGRRVLDATTAVIDAMTEATQRAGVALSINLTGGVFVNQSAGVLRLPRHRRQPGRQRQLHRLRPSSPAASA